VSSTAISQSIRPSGSDTSGPCNELRRRALGMSRRLGRTWAEDEIASGEIHDSISCRSGLISLRARLGLRSRRKGQPSNGPCCGSACTTCTVGSRTDARMLGTGGYSFAFARGLIPAAMITFSVPATSNRTGAFNASGFPIDFTIELSGMPFAHE
jgi:hypothetical protein